MAKHRSDSLKFETGISKATKLSHQSCHHDRDTIKLRTLKPKALPQLHLQTPSLPSAKRLPCMCLSLVPPILIPEVHEVLLFGLTVQEFRLIIRAQCLGFRALGFCTCSKYPQEILQRQHFTNIEPNPSAPVVSLPEVLFSSTCTTRPPQTIQVRVCCRVSL